MSNANEACSWPEQDAVDAWLDANGIEVSQSAAMALKVAVTEYRMKVQKERATPAALAASPEGQALIGAAYRSGIFNGVRACGVSDHVAERAFRAFTPADALTALAARDARMRAEGMERAAEMADREHGREMVSKGRNPADYTGRFSLFAAAIRAAKEGGGE
jgi:hypothetical protein